VLANSFNSRVTHGKRLRFQEPVTPVLLGFCLLFVLCLLGVKPAIAHPMGNFSISHYSKLVVGSSALDLLYIIDLAEVPTFQEKTLLDANGDGSIDSAEKQRYLAKKTEELIAGLRLRLNGSQYPFRKITEQAELIPGGLNLPTLKLSWHFQLSWHQVVVKEINALEYEDRNFPGRVGWKEIVAMGSDSVQILESSVPTTDLSRQLTAYPEDPMTQPPQDLSARLQFRLQSQLSSTKAPSAASQLPGSSSGGTSGSATSFQQPGAKTLSDQRRLMQLLSTSALSPNIILLALVVAFGLGAFHALSPGHGKTVVGAYLVGSRGTARHAVLLGIIVTVTHTLGVFLLGLVTLYASKYILPEKLYPWLGFASGLAVTVIGLGLFRQRYHLLHAHVSSTHFHTHGHSHSHDGTHRHDPHFADHDPAHDLHHHHAHEHFHEHSHGWLTHTHGGVTHSHDYSNVTFRDLFALGVTGGMVPCPSALVVLLSAISLNRVGLGLLLIVAFSFGLALVLMAIGLMMVYARGFMERFGTGGRLWRILPVLSSLVVAVLGAVIAVQSLVSGGVLQIQLSALK
jgi:nickel/cobalt transporter (NicO) family protein